jgi:hypothetical protein
MNQKSFQNIRTLIDLFFLNVLQDGFLSFSDHFITCFLVNYRHFIDLLREFGHSEDVCILFEQNDRHSGSSLAEALQKIKEKV